MKIFLAIMEFGAAAVIALVILSLCAAEILTKSVAKRIFIRR